MPSISKVALVTGSGKRLGRQIAAALAENGFAVAVHYYKSGEGARRLERSIRAKWGSSIAVKADVSKRAQVVRMVEKVMEAFGRIDVLVNNAAVFEKGSLQDVTEDQWNAIMDINLKGPFLCSQAVAPYMLKEKRGQIINIVSLGGLQAWSEHLAYSVSKAGAIMLTRCIAKALAPHIRVNAVAPGTIILKGEEDPTVKHLPRKNILLKKFGRPADITDMVVFLATRADYITGQVFAVDGGRSIQ